MRKKAIILVAGMGTRLKPLTLNNHKCLTKVNDKPILHNALDRLKMIGVSEALLVVGYLADKIREDIGDEFHGLKIRYAENDVYAATNTSFSLNIGLENISEYDSLFVLEGDVFFSPGLLQRIDECEAANVTLLEKYQPNLDGSFVEVDDNGYVIDWIHKSVRESGFTIEDKYKTINIHKFDREFVADTLKMYVQKFCGIENGKAPLELAMQGIVRDFPQAIYGLESAGMKWFEIDDAGDLKIAEEIFGEEPK